jgi:hypothetical protein
MRRLVMAIALLAAFAPPAAAQPQPWAPERITAGWVFTPSIVLGGLYDTNPTLQQNGTPITEELVGLVNPRTEIDFNGRRAKFSAGYSGTLETYSELSELTRYDQRGRLDAQYRMTPRLNFQTRQQLTLSPTTDQLDVEGLPFTRVGSTMVTSTGGFTFDFTERLELTTEYLFQWVNFDRETEDVADFRFLQGGHAHSPSAELQYALSRRLKVGALYVYRYTVIDAGEEILGNHRAQALVQYDIGPSTLVRGKAGFDYVGLINTELTRTGPSYGASITHRIRDISFDGSFERMFIPSFSFGGLQAHKVFRASAHVPFAHTRAFATGGVTYRQSDPVILRNVLVELDSLWTSATVGYSISRWLRAEVFVSMNHQTSSAQGDVSRTRAGIQFVTSKPVRIQ